MLKKLAIQLSGAIALLTVSGAVLAGSASTSIPVSASVTQNCSISSTPLAFTAYDPIGTNATAQLDATGTISVACSKGAKSLSIGMDNGTNFGSTKRQMKGTGTNPNMLQYIIYQSSTAPLTPCTFGSGGTEWTTTGGGLLRLDSPLSKDPRVYNVCGTIPGGQDVAADTYTDTVGATINF